MVSSKITDELLANEDLLKTVKEKFNLYVIKKDGACWGWKRLPINQGWVRLYIKGRPLGAHRVSWLIHKGKIPPYHFVKQTCGNNYCTNPDHLYVTQKRESHKNKEHKAKKRIGRERISVDVPSSLYAGVKDELQKRNITMTRYIIRLILSDLKNSKRYS